MNNQYYSQRPEQENPPLPIIDLIILAVLAIATIVFSAIAASKSFGAYKYPIRSLLDVFSVIAVFEVLIWISKLFSRKKRIFKCRVSSDYKPLKALCIIIAVIGLLNAPMFFFDVGVTDVGNFFEKREYIVTNENLTFARVCDWNGYHYEAVAYYNHPATGEVFPDAYFLVNYIFEGKERSAIVVLK